MLICELHASDEGRGLRGERHDPQVLAPILGCDWGGLRAPDRRDQQPTDPGCAGASFVAGAGIIEASTENITIGTPVSGVVTDIFVTVGQAATAGDPLFKLDDRNLQAELAVRQTALRQAKERLPRLRSMPRLRKSLKRRRV